MTIRKTGKDGIRRFREAKRRILEFLCKNFGNGAPFKWKDVVMAGWTGRRWDLRVLRKEGYLRRSRKIKSAYTYARGVSNGAKYGQVVPRKRHEKVQVAEAIGTSKRRDRVSIEKDKVQAAIEIIEEQIAELTDKKKKLEELYINLDALPTVDSILKS